MVDDYAVGDALHAVESTERARAARDNPALTAEAIAYGVGQLATGEFPELSALNETTGAGDDALTERFETGLRALPRGLAG